MKTLTDAERQAITKRNRSSRVSSALLHEQELTPFGSWSGKPIWVPPKDASTELANTMLNRCGPFASRDTCWQTAVKEHRSEFTQVREFKLAKPSIRLSGRLFMSVTERERFDEIEDTVPDCVRTRLEEFLEGPGKQRGVKVYYLKPLCIEVDHELIFTTLDEVNAAIQKIQTEAFGEYRRMYLGRQIKKLAIGAVDISLAVPRAIMNRAIATKRREIEAYEAHLEFNRRRTALDAAELHRELRSDGCTFHEMLSLTNQPARADVIQQYADERDLSETQKQMLIMATAATLPWFVGLSLGVLYMATVSATAAAATAPVAVCDPAFVAEMPGSKGVVLKIGHFDEIDGVTHVEI